MGARDSADSIKPVEARLTLGVRSDRLSGAGGSGVCLRLSPSRDSLERDLHANHVGDQSAFLYDQQRKLVPASTCTACTHTPPPQRLASGSREEATCLPEAREGQETRLAKWKGMKLRDALASLMHVAARMTDRLRTLAW